MLALGVHGDLVHRARPIQRVERDEVVELVRAHLLQRLAHALGLELEHARWSRRARASRTCAGRRAAASVQSGRAPLERSMMSSASSITSRLRSPRKSIFRMPISSIGFIENCVTVRKHALAVLVGAGVGELQRHDVRQRPVGDHDRGGVDRGVAHDPLEPLRDVDDLLGRRVLVAGLAQRLSGLQAFLERRRAAHDRVGDQLRQAIARAVVEAEHARRVARGGAREHLAEGDDLRDRLAPVLLGHVAHHPLAPAHREVDVDVRHRHALGVQEALEQQVVAQRVDVGDRQAVGDDRARRRAAARPDGDAVLLGEGLTKSQTIRKYALKPMRSITSSSISMRSTAAAGGGSP